MANNDEDFAFESGEHGLDQGDNTGEDLALPQAADADAEVMAMAYQHILVVHAGLSGPLESSVLIPK
eukprot:2571-Heterococcus_DN1.PRE.1